MKAIHKAALIRAYRTAIQTLLSLIPAGFSVNFVAGVDWKTTGLTVLGMICTAIIAGCISFLQGVLGGLPEVLDEAFDEDDIEFYEMANTLEHDEMETEPVSEEVE